MAAIAQTGPAPPASVPPGERYHRKVPMYAFSFLLLSFTLSSGSFGLKYVETLLLF